MTGPARTHLLNFPEAGISTSLHEHPAITSGDHDLRTRAQQKLMTNVPAQTTQIRGGEVTHTWSMGHRFVNRPIADELSRSGHRSMTGTGMGLAMHNTDRARAAGLVTRPLETTLTDVLTWEQGSADPAPHGPGYFDGSGLTTGPTFWGHIWLEVMLPARGCTGAQGGTGVTFGPSRPEVEQVYRRLAWSSIAAAPVRSTVRW